jgi:hypothetical protein
MTYRKIFLTWGLFAMLCASSVPAQGPQGQAAAGPPAAQKAPDCLDGMVQDLKTKLAGPNRQDALAGAKRIVQRWPVYVCQFTTDAIKTRLMAQAEQKRLDKQPGATSSSSGSTSLVSKGSSPWLLGFALEHGGLTQTTDGTTVTFRGNVTNSIRALLDSTYLGSYKLKENDPLVQALAKLSFGVSFDTSSTSATASQGFSPSTGNFSGFSTKYEIINHRDPRDKRYRSQWSALASREGTAIAARIGDLDAAITRTHEVAYDAWFAAVSQELDDLPQSASDEQIRRVAEDAANTFHERFWDFAEIKNAVASLTSSMSGFLEKQDKTVNEIRGTPLVTVEYNYTRQHATANQTVVATQPNQTIPSLSNINLVLERGISGGNTPEFTFNAGATFFNSANATTPSRGTLRDYRISAELDVPLRPIDNVGRPTLSFSGQFLSLRQEPLGQKVTLNAVTITRTGNMGVFQTKLSIPIKNSGVKIPISFTYASRTELVKEHDVRGNIGITFDLDSLFSKSN